MRLTPSQISILTRFIGPNQLAALRIALLGEEREYFVEMLGKLAAYIDTMPIVYEQEGKGEDAIVGLHYFKARADFYITEKDSEIEQYQAFGLADLFQDGGELGYISIEELKENNV